MAKRHAKLTSISKYGLSKSDYFELLARQEGRCAICKQTKLFPLFVDHDHMTGQVRGLLCRLCNLALGSLHDDPLRCRLAASYLEDPPMKQYRYVRAKGGSKNLKDC